MESNELKNATKDIASILGKMEKDLHSIDISLGILVGQMTENEPKKESVHDIGEMAYMAVYGDKKKGEE